MKKLFILGTSLCIFGMIAYGQERVNREKIHFTNQSEVLLNATGWAYNETIGEWIGYENVIYHNKEYQTSGPTIYMKSHLPNFNSIQAKAITYNGIEYVCLIVNQWRGYYEYPEIREDWQTYTVNVYYFLSKEEYNKLFKLTNKITEIKGWSDSYVESVTYSEEDFVVSKIKSQQNSKSSLYKPYTFLRVYKATDGNIRFLFKTLSEYPIENNYFETTEDNWYNLEIPALNTNVSMQDSLLTKESNDNKMDISNNLFAEADLFNFNNLPILAMDVSLGKMEHGTALGFGATLAGFHFEYMLNLSASGFGEHLAELGQWTGNDGYGLMFGYFFPLTRHIDIAPIAVFERYSEGNVNGDNWWVSSQGVTNEVQITMDSKKWSWGISILGHFNVPSFEDLGDCGIGLTITNNYFGINLTFMRMNIKQTDDFRTR